MTKMNYNSSSNRYIQAHTLNPRWNSQKAYKSHLNSPVTVIKADGTVTVEKPLTSDEIDKVNKIKKKRRKKKLHRTHRGEQAYRARQQNQAKRQQPNAKKFIPPTEKQIKYMKHLGIQYTEGLSIGDCSRLISTALKNRQNNGQSNS